jgi:elongation factor Tu
MKIQHLKKGEDQWVDKIFDLMEKVDTYIPTPVRDTEKLSGN